MKTVEYVFLFTVLNQIYKLSLKHINYNILHIY